MNYKMIGRILSWILLLEAAFMTPALVISACLGELEAVHAFALSMGLTLAAALVLYMVGRRARMGLFARDGLVCVGMGWIVMSIFGGLPFWSRADCCTGAASATGWAAWACWCFCWQCCR